MLTKAFIKRVQHFQVVQQQSGAAACVWIDFLGEILRRSMLRGLRGARLNGIVRGQYTLDSYIISQDHAAVASGRSESAAKHRNQPASTCHQQGRSATVDSCR